ncbi:MAG TPA: PucR family transcriptional regulator ligand-binding domain-containing protein [Anaerolineales bacterium]|nr:PucR family transcriptional regulator ligand-binding domain-containing protein [Anaerolineales bacterium]
MPLTLREAMTLVEPLRRARLVGGAAGLDHVVESVNVMEVPDILEWVHPGELLVTTMYPLRDDAAAIEALVPSLADRGLAGLAVTRSGYLDEFPPAMVRAADERAFPLIELPQKVSFIDIIQPITSEILRLQARELLQSIEIHRQFIDLVLSGGTYRDIAQGIAQRVQRPVTIVDRFRRVLGEGFLMGQPPVHKAFVHDESGGDRTLSDLYQPRALGPIEGSEAVLRTVDGPAGAVDHIACPVLVGPMGLGEILVWGPWDAPPSSMDLIVIQHGTTVTALKMMEARTITEAEERFRNEILEGLLSSSPDERRRALQQSNELGHRLAPPFAVVLVGPDLLRGLTLTKVESLEKRNLDTSLHLAERYLRLLQPSASFWFQGARLVAFLPVTRAALAESRTRLVHELQAVCQRVGAENAPYTVSMGVSPCVFDLEDFRIAYECARQSLQIGSAQEAGGTGRVTHYEDLGLFRVVSLAENPAGVERFCLDAIGPLIAYDRENDSNLTVTLRTFLENNQNFARTAKLLFVHYNTLRYRIDRAREILGDFLENHQQRLEIELALQLYPLIGRFPPSERPH